MEGGAGATAGACAAGADPFGGQCRGSGRNRENQPPTGPGATGPQHRYWSGAGTEVALIALAQWVLQNAWVQLLAAAYLFSYRGHLRERDSDPTQPDSNAVSQTSSRSLMQTVILLGFTDLAFSIDSVAAAVAVSDQILLISTGAAIGIVALRFTSGLFIRWLDEYPRLETAGFLSVAFVAQRLVIHVLLPAVNQPDWLTLIVVLLLFTWGLSVRTPEAASHAG